MRKVAQDSLYSFPRTKRLLSKRDFEHVFAKPFKVTRHSLVVLYRPNAKPIARLGIILAKQHIKQAVARNRLRRLLRESFRRHQDSLKGLDIIVLLRSEWSTQQHAIWQREVDQLWQLLIEPRK